MNVRLVTDELLAHDTPLLVLPVFEGATELAPLQEAVDARAGGALARARHAGDFRGKAGDSLLVYLSGAGGGPERGLFLGAGSPQKLDAEAVRALAGRAVRAAEKLRIRRLTLRVEPGSGSTSSEFLAQAAAEASVLAAWEFRELKTREEEGEETPPHACVEEVELSLDGDAPELGAAVAVGEAQGRAENLARLLQSRPGNVATPAHLAEQAQVLAAELPLEVTVLGPEELRAEGMGALLAVSQGSREEPRLIVMRYRGGGGDEAPLALVGKGLTFDAGGISIKPAAGMEDMKYDMSGGAAVIAAMKGVAELGLRVNVVGIVPASENLPSGTAVKPGDVITTRSGKTVEVINTDAEGRLILADALDYARSLEPAAIVDCATLTGACVIALGNHASAVLGNDDDLVRQVRDAGERSGERCWPLPLWDAYSKQIESDVADIKNVGGRPAGTITAACFLKEFVGDRPWAHLDIAGTAYGEGKGSYQRKGALGVPTRLLMEWVRSRAG